MAVHIRKGDIVQVMVGDEQERGRVLSVDAKAGKVVVENVNRVYKHLRKSQKNPQGGRLSKEMPVAISNVMLIDPQTNQPTRTGVRYLPDGSKELYAKKSGATIRRIAGPNPKYATP